MVATGRMKDFNKRLIMFSLIVILIIGVSYSLGNNYEGFQYVMYDQSKSISDIISDMNYFRFLGLTPENNVSFREATELYKKRTGKDYNPNSTEEIDSPGSNILTSNSESLTSPVVITTGPPGPSGPPGPPGPPGPSGVTSNYDSIIESIYKEFNNIYTALNLPNPRNSARTPKQTLSYRQATSEQSLLLMNTFTGYSNFITDNLSEYITQNVSSITGQQLFNFIRNLVLNTPISISNFTVSSGPPSSIPQSVLRLLETTLTYVMNEYIINLDRYIITNRNITDSQFIQFTRNWLVTTPITIPENLTSVNQYTPRNQQKIQTFISDSYILIFNNIILTYLSTTPNATSNQIASYLQNMLVTGNGLTEALSLPSASSNTTESPQSNLTASSETIRQQIRNVTTQIGPILNAKSYLNPLFEEMSVQAPYIQRYLDQFRNNENQLFLNYLNSLLIFITNATPSTTSREILIFTRDFLASQGIVVSEPLSTVATTEGFIDSSKKIYKDFTIRYNTIPTEYAAAL